MAKFETLLQQIDAIKLLDFGSVINDSIELFKKVWLQGVILVLILTLFSTPFLIVYIPVLEGMKASGSGAYDPEQITLLFENNLERIQYLTLGFTFGYGIISTIFVAAFYRIVKKIDADESYVFSDYFYFFKLKTLGKVFAIATFALLVALLGFVLEKFMPTFSAGLLKSAVSIICSVYSALFVVFLAFNPDLETSDIFVLSFRLGSKKWGFIFGALIVGGLLGLLGLFACFIGVFFTLTIAYLPIYQIYKTVFFKAKHDDINSIGTEEY